jgi:prepilin-type N-terminal cleavage/methylation domain-containing protein
MIDAIRMHRAPRATGGFTLLEVLLTTVIIGIAVTGVVASVGQYMNTAMVTKVNRQMRYLVDYQIGQIAVGKFHPDEQDPFPDGQSGDFSDVGGYAEEYEAFTWDLKREEIPICGADELELEKAGFESPRRQREGTGDTRMFRPQTDDILAGTDEDLVKPKGQFKSRVTLTVRWHGPSQEDDRSFSIVTYLPVNGEEAPAADDAALGGGEGDPSKAGGDKTGQPASGTDALKGGSR